MVTKMEFITSRQQEVLDFIISFLQKNSYPPTLRDIMENFGFTSPNGVTHHIKALVRKGALNKNHGKARGLALVFSGNEFNQNLAQQAFDIQMRLKWFALPDGNKWYAAKAVGECENSLNSMPIMPREIMHFPEPNKALVEAEKWIKKSLPRLT